MQGYHLTFFPDWLDMYHNRQTAVKNKFGSMAVAFEHAQRQIHQIKASSKGRERRPFHGGKVTPVQAAGQPASGSLLQRLKNAITILSIMVTWALENAIETADSMKSRGYGLPGRTAAAP